MTSISHPAALVQSAADVCCLGFNPECKQQKKCCSSVYYVRSFTLNQSVFMNKGGPAAEFTLTSVISSGSKVLQLLLTPSRNTPEINSCSLLAGGTATRPAWPALESPPRASLQRRTSALNLRDISALKYETGGLSFACVFRHQHLRVAVLEVLLISQWASFKE